MKNRTKPHTPKTTVTREHMKPNHKVERPNVPVAKTAKVHPGGNLGKFLHPKK